ncbi:ankyrin repeat domain-containing protein [Hahella ganghwensis]|uniref:ankyrin repeat domain-containing protein n=1 Tax=Hahella ganghwensis TaxID=286420 RepID=UPI000370DE4D|nr:ankyrin repeat domain-containing protein [Hahella ganghwensis]
MNKRNFVFFVGITLLSLILSGCFYAGRAIQGVVGLSSDHCEDWHPVYASMSGCSPKANFGVTTKNANDTVYQRCLLIHAIGKGRYDVFSSLLGSGADPSKCGDNYQAEIYNAWISGGGCYDKRFIERFERNGLEPSQSAEELLEFSLRMACGTGVSLAVAKGADPNAVRKNGALPLDAVVWSTSLDRIRTVEILVKLGADPFKVSPKTGVSPYQYAVENSSKLNNWPLLEKALLQN